MSFEACGLLGCSCLLFWEGSCKFVVKSLVVWLQVELSLKVESQLNCLKWDPNQSLGTWR